MKSLCWLWGCECRSIKGGLLTNLNSFFDNQSFPFVFDAWCSLRGLLFAAVGPLWVGSLPFSRRHLCYIRSLPFVVGGGWFDRCLFWSHGYLVWAWGISWRWRRSRIRKGSGLEIGFAHRSTFLLYGKAYSLSTHTF